MTGRAVDARTRVRGAVSVDQVWQALAEQPGATAPMLAEQFRCAVMAVARQLGHLRRHARAHYVRSVVAGREIAAWFVGSAEQAEPVRVNEAELARAAMARAARAAAASTWLGQPPCARAAQVFGAREGRCVWSVLGAGDGAGGAA